MITEAILSVLIKIVGKIMEIFPKAVPGQNDTNIYTALDYFFGILHKGDNFLPIQTMLAVFSIILATEGILLAFNFGVWMYKRIRG